MVTAYNGESAGVWASHISWLMIALCFSSLFVNSTCTLESSEKLFKNTSAPLHSRN